MVWLNPFRKKKFMPSENFVQKQLEFTNKVGELMKKQNEAIRNYQAILKLKDDQLEAYKGLIDAINKRPDVVEKPEFLNDNPVYSPRLRITTRGGEEVVTLEPRQIYSSSEMIVKIVENNNWRSLYLEDKKKCAKEIWDYVIEAIKYEYDKEEDWRFSPISLTRGAGDCEDGTIIFLDLAREAGFRPDEVFNACGWVTTTSGEKFGHSFPILNYGSGWFIYETTLDSTRSAPMRFLGSKYDASWGCANWYFQGRIKGDKNQI